MIVSKFFLNFFCKKTKRIRRKQKEEGSWREEEEGKAEKERKWRKKGPRKRQKGKEAKKLFFR